MRLLLESAIGRRCWNQYVGTLRNSMERERFARAYRNKAPSGWDNVNVNLRLLRIRALQEATEQWLLIDGWEKSPPEKRTEPKALTAFAKLIETPTCVVRDVTRPPEQRRRRANPALAAKRKKEQEQQQQSKSKGGYTRTLGKGGSDEANEYERPMPAPPLFHGELKEVS